MESFKIVQGENDPIGFSFSGDDPSAFSSMSMTLWSSIVSPGESVGKRMKQWTKSDADISEYDVSLPITQEESIGFIPGPCRLEIKWMRSDGNTDNTDELFGSVVPFDDDTILE